MAISTHLEHRISGELREQQECDPVLFPIHQRRAHHSRNYLGPAPIQRTFQCGIWIHPSAPDLQRYPGDIQRAEYQSRVHFRLLSLRKATGRIVMPEVLEEQHSDPPDMQRYMDVTLRRHPHFLISVFLGWLVVWGISWILPVSYKSGTLI